MRETNGVRMALELENAQAKIAELTRSVEAYRDLVENARDMIWRTDRRGRVTYVNGYVQEFLGLTPQSALGREIDQYMTAESALRVTKGAREAFFSTPVLSNFIDEVEYVHKSGTLVPAELRMWPELDASGQIVGLNGVSREISDRKRAEEALRESEARYRSILMASPDDVTITDLEGRILMVSPSAVSMFGGEREEDFLGRDAMDFLMPEDRERATSNLALMFEGVRTSPDQYRGRRMDGSPLEVEINKEFIRGSDGKPTSIVLVVRDISERKKAEEALRESEEKYRTVADFTYDWEAWRAPDGIYRYVSPSCERICGRRAEEFLANPSLMVEITHPDDRDKFTAHLREVDDVGRREGCAAGLDYRIRRPDGEVRWISHTCTAVYGKGGQYLGRRQSNRDITSRKEAEEALLLQSRFQQLLIEISSTYINLPLDAAESVIRDSLGNMAEFVGVDRAYIFEYDYNSQICTNTHEWCAEAVPLSYMPEWVRRHERGEAVYVPDLFSLPPGNLRDILEPQGIKSLLTVPMMSKGDCIGFVGFDSVHHHRNYSDNDQNLLRVFAGMLVNVWRRKRTVEEKTKLEAQLRQAQKMELVGQLAGGVAHDFNNMLAVILGHADLARDYVEASDPICAELHEITQAAKRSTELTRQLLTFARKQTVTPKVLDLNETIARTVNMLRRLIGEDIQLLWNPEPNLWPIKVDPSQMDQILANLSINARDAITGVGTVSIGTDNVTLGELFCRTHPGSVPGDYVRLSVSDTGIGMDKATADRVFEPFFTTKGQGKGTGLGLAIVYGAVTQNHGFVTLRSEVGKGTTFEIYLPRVAAAISILPPMETRASHGNETLLLAEDEEPILRLQERILKKSGYRVLAAKTPTEALAMAEGHDGPIQLLVTDVVMPGMNGRELCEKIRLIHPKIKVLFVSGYTGDIIADRGIIDEGVRFLPKPFTAQTLGQKVRAVLDE